MFWLIKVTKQTYYSDNKTHPQTDTIVWVSVVNKVKTDVPVLDSNIPKFVGINGLTVKYTFYIRLTKRVIGILYMGSTIMPVKCPLFWL